MRRLTDDELTHIIRLARDGRRGPSRAIDALWELTMQEIHGIGLAEAAERGFHVQDYSLDRDQNEAIRDAMVERRRLPRKVIAGFWVLWASYSPADHDPTGPEPDDG